MPIRRSGYAIARRRPDTAAWRRTRALILNNAHHRCAICHHIATHTDPLEIDHIVAVADGGSDEPNNLRAVHRSCNRKRGRA